MDSVESSKARALGVGTGVGLLGIVVAVVLALTVGQLVTFAGIELSPLEIIVLTLVLTQGFAFGGTALAYLRHRGLSLRAIGVEPPSGRDLLVALAGWLTAIGLLIAAGILIQYLSAPTAENQAAQFGRENPEVLLLLVPASFLVIGPGEELLFRGVVQTRLREAFTPWAAIGLASALFAAIHYVALSGSGVARLVTISILFFPSLVFGTVYEYTGNLAVPSLVHGAYNATLFSLLYLSLRYGDEMAALL